jgi:hypothetical protein
MKISTLAYVSLDIKHVKMVRDIMVKQSTDSVDCK